MINLTTSCSKSDTFLAVLLLSFFVTSVISFGQVEELTLEQNQSDPALSVLELDDDSKNASNGNDQDTQLDPFALQTDSVLSNVTVAKEPQQDQTPNLPATLVDGIELEGPEVLLRGPLHEAFADVHQADPQPNPIVDATPPETINEVPPEFKPEGSNVQWIPGYWSWDESQDDFIWISGVWRDVPPDQRWVPGYWEQVENGHRWITGFWTSLEKQELNYLPTPPASLDQGPSIAAPSDDYFYCPGNWEFQNNRYVWRTGHWQPRVENWIWVPARYIWTPLGCIYRPGYWDREFDVRGVLFAPVQFRPHQYLATGFTFQPNHCVNTGADFFVHLFVHPRNNHYFYGNWYGQNFVNTGFRPWVHPRSHFRNYDPLLAHYNCSRYRHGNQLLINWVSIQHQHYHRNRAHRPRNTFHAQVNFSKSLRNHHYHDFVRRAKLANRYDDIVRVRSNGRNLDSRNNNRNLRIDNSNFKKNYVKTDHRDRDQRLINERIQREIRKARKLAEQRSKSSTPNIARLAKDATRNQPKDRRQSQVGPQKKQVVNGNVTGPRKKQNSDTRNRAKTASRDIARNNKLALPKAQVTQIAKADRDREKAHRKRELDQKIAAAKQQADIKRKQRETAQELSNRQRQQRLVQTQQRIANEKQARQSARNQNASLSKKRSDEQRVRALASQNNQQKLEEQRRKQQQAQRQRQASRTVVANGKQQGAQGPSNRTAQRQQADLAKQQRDTQRRIAAERAKQTAERKIAQSREASRQRDLQRQREKAASAQAAAQRRRELQAKVAREKSQRDAERRASLQRNQQKAQADAQRRAREKSQRDAQRNAANQARRAADAAQKRQRQQEQAARRAKKKKK